MLTRMGSRRTAKSTMSHPFPVISLFRGGDDLLGTSRDKFLKLLRLVWLEFSGRTGRLSLEFPALVWTPASFELSPVFGRLQRSDVVVHELSVGFNEGVHVRIAKVGKSSASARAVNAKTENTAASVRAAIRRERIRVKASS